jgi:hypothetical protein
VVEQKDVQLFGGIPLLERVPNLLDENILPSDGVSEERDAAAVAKRCTYATKSSETRNLVKCRTRCTRRLRDIERNVSIALRQLPLEISVALLQ